MKQFFLSIFSLCLLVSLATATTTTVPIRPQNGVGTLPTLISTIPPAPVVVNPPGMGFQNGVTVVNGNYHGDYPTLTGSTGTVRLRAVPGHLANSEVKCDNGARVCVTGLESGDNVVVSTNSSGAVTGNGGSVSVGNGSTITITNTSAPNGPAITATLPGGSTVSIPGGSTATIQG